MYIFRIADKSVKLNCLKGDLGERMIFVNRDFHCIRFCMKI